jgi:NSS family neurotransmitter:Na+ symporter
MEKRSTFSGRMGFVFAAAASAVGLGNIWRFPYLAAQYGGGIFLFVYIVLVLTFGFTLMMTEIAIGRKTGLSAIGAYKALDKRFSFVGIITSIIPLIIVPYYCVIGGWVSKYTVSYIIGEHSDIASANFFTDFSSQTGEPIVWMLIFLAATFIFVLLGVKKGIEKASKILMPLLIGLCIVVAIYALTLDGAIDGFLYYITPDFSNFSANTVLGAMGQMFYSMSLAMGIMITYGSYMKKDSDIEKSVKQIEIFDTLVAFLAGLMIIPAFYVFSGGQAENMNAGVSLMFETMPKVFESMAMSTFVGSAFFILVLFAALTSSISLMETVVSIFMDKFKLSRTKTCLIVLGIIFVIAIPSSLGFGLLSDIKPFGMDFLTFFDFISNNLMMPIVAIITCIFVGYFIKPKTIIDEVKLSSKFKRERMYKVFIKFVAPVFLVLILISSFI